MIRFPDAVVHQTGCCSDRCRAVRNIRKAGGRRWRRRYGHGRNGSVRRIEAQQAGCTKNHNLAVVTYRDGIRPRTDG